MVRALRWHGYRWPAPQVIMDRGRQLQNRRGLIDLFLKFAAYVRSRCDRSATGGRKARYGCSSVPVGAD